MKCPNCGREIADDSKFCDFCGTKLVSDPVAPAAEEKASFIQRLGSFLIPLAGIIIYFANKKERPTLAKECLICALWGIAIPLIFEVAIFIAN